MNPTLTVTEQGRTRFVVGEPAAAQTTAIVARPIDVQSLATDAMSSNTAMVTAILRQMQPTVDQDQRQQAQPGLSSASELAARNQRFRWVVVAVVVLSAITAAGIVSVAFIGGHVSGPAALAGWLVLSGVVGYLSVTFVHHREANLTPEAIELERVRSDYDVQTTDAESRQLLARAYSSAIVDDAAARRAAAEAQRQANIAAIAPARQPMDYTPRSTPEPVQWHEPTPAQDETQPCAPIAPTVEPDQVLLRLLTWLRETYEDCDRRDSTLITSTLPWAARGDLAAGDKARAIAVLAAFDPPLIETKAGNRAHLNRQWRRRVAELILAREWR